LTLNTKNSTEVLAAETQAREDKNMQGPLNILMASGVPKRREGGVASIIYNLGRELERRGHSVTYVFQEDLIKNSVSFRFRELIFAKRLAGYIARNHQRFSVVDLHAPDGMVYGFRKRWRDSFPPYVMTLHGLEERRIHVMSREDQKGRAFNFSLKNRIWHKVYHLPRYRWSILNADGARVYSRDVWTMLQLKYNLDSDRVAYIPNGVESRFFIPREYRSEDSVRLLYAGTWLDQRGIFYLREAVREASRKFPGLTLTIAGGGVSQEYLTDFFGSELVGKVVALPVVDSGRMQEIYAQHDILVFPSLVEGLPGVLLEAMATGMAVITAETCGMTDVVHSDVNGLLVPPADSKALEAAILRLARSPELRQTLGSAAREAMRRHSWEESAEKLEGFYYHILAAKRK
jgi:glycosyltransferase involved in cell wall biosynthesis